MAPERSKIEKQQSTRDLGENMSSFCGFAEHIQCLTSKGKQMAGWILRTFQTRDENAMRSFYKLIVAPITEYSCQLWSPLTL